MKQYLVSGGVARLGVGDVIEMSEDQYKARAHNVDVVSRGAGTVICRSAATLEFMVGEKIGLTDLPMHLATILVPVGQPTSDADKAAIFNQEVRDEENRKPARVAAKDKPKAKSKR